MFISVKNVYVWCGGFLFYVVVFVVYSLVLVINKVYFLKYMIVVLFSIKW